MDLFYLQEIYSQNKQNGLVISNQPMTSLFFPPGIFGDTGKRRRHCHGHCLPGHPFRIPYQTAFSETPHRPATDDIVLRFFRCRYQHGGLCIRLHTYTGNCCGNERAFPCPGDSLRQRGEWYAQPTLCLCPVASDGCLGHHLLPLDRPMRCAVYHGVPMVREGRRNMAYAGR